MACSVTRTAVSPAYELGHRALGVSNGLPCRAIQAARQTSRRAASIRVCMSASMNAIAWFWPIGRPNCSRSRRSRGRTSYAARATPTAMRATPGRVGLEGRHRGLHRRCARPRGPGPAARRACPCRRAGSGRAPARRRARPRRCARRGCRACANFWPWLSPGCRAGRRRWPGRGCPARGRPRLTTVHVGDAAVGGPGLGAVEHPLVLGLVVDARVRIAPTSLPASGSEEQNAASFRSPGEPNICGAHSATCSGVPLPRPRPRRGRADDGQADARVAPEQLLHGERRPSPVSLEALGGEEVERVQPDLGGLLEHRPRGLLALVPLGRSRAYDVLGEGVHPLLQVDVVRAELEARRRGGSVVAHPLEVTDGSPDMRRPPAGHSVRGRLGIELRLHVLVAHVGGVVRRLGLVGALGQAGRPQDRGQRHRDDQVEPEGEDGDVDLGGVRHGSSTSGPPKWSWVGDLTP